MIREEEQFLFWSLSGVLAVLLVLIVLVLRRTQAEVGLSGGPAMRDKRPMGQFVGWVRFGWKKWRPVVDHDNELQCRHMLDYFFTEDVDGEKIVLPREELPRGCSTSTRRS